MNRLASYLGRRHAVLVETMLKTLTPFDFGIEGVEVTMQHAKLTDNKIVFKRRAPGMMVTLSVPQIVVTAEGLSWEDADKFLGALDAILKAAVGVCQVKIKSQLLGLIMHVQFKAKPAVEVTSCLLSESAYGLLEGEKESQGISVVRGKASVLVDKSQGYANSIFVKIYREHKTETSLADIAKTLRSDESRLFDTLKVDVDA